MEHLTLISYNLWENRAEDEISDLVYAHQPDILCLQEAITDQLPSTIANLSLASATDNNRLGLALYYNHDIFDLENTGSFALKKSLHDRVLSPASERVLAARLVLRESQQSLVAASFHASPLSARNKIRRHQITAAHYIMQSLNSSLPAKQPTTKKGKLQPVTAPKQRPAPTTATIMAGDYNYPLFQKKLSRILDRDGYSLHRSDRHTYSRWLKGHYDFITASRAISIANVTTLRKGQSDHLPICATFTL